MSGKSSEKNHKKQISHALSTLCLKQLRVIFVMKIELHYIPEFTKFHNNQRLCQGVTMKFCVHVRNSGIEYCLARSF